jgi:hypothetical protein
MRPIVVALVFAAISACSDSPACDLEDAGYDAVVDAATDAPLDAPVDVHADAVARDDLGRICTCTSGPCCDGCRWLRPGDACDDDLTCTVDTYCLSDHTCVGGTSPCDRTIEAPDCQAEPTCSEQTGCSTAWTRLEGEVCPVGGDQTFACHAGECINVTDVSE